MVLLKCNSMDQEPIIVRSLDIKRFNALIGASRSPALEYYGTELDWLANVEETIIGVLIQDLTDRDFVAVALARDDTRRFRCIDVQSSLATLDEARNWLVRAIRWHTVQAVPGDSQPDRAKNLDLFAPVVPLEKQHVYFRDLLRSDALLPARSIIAELMPHFVDIDGTFVREFQTNGFDARLWELYLNAYFIEEKLFINRKHTAPDFMIRKYGQAVAIEAAIVGRQSPIRMIQADAAPQFPIVAELLEKNRNEIPIRFGSALFTKLQKKYWELPHVRGMPLVFAIADFHDDCSMTWSSPGLMRYLYGFEHRFEHDPDGQLVITPQQITTHKKGSKTIPSGFFFQAEAENVSAILFSACGTISKFGRMGRQAGFHHPNMTMQRIGTCHNHEPNACFPHQYSYEVNETCRETWAEGLSMFHNPQACAPVPLELFPSIAHHRLVDGQIVSHVPEFHPLSSFTIYLAMNKSA